jgi:hypothetical protein
VLAPTTATGLLRSAFVAGGRERARLEEASASHLAGVRAFLEERFSGEELDQLAALLGRLPEAAGASGEDCAA